MAYIVMGRDECNSEFRPSPLTHINIDSAYDELVLCRDSYPEARAMWVEELRDKDYYIRQKAYEEWAGYTGYYDE